MLANVVAMETMSALLAAGQTDGGGAADAIQVQSVWDFLIKGGPMIIPIAVCSLAALTVIVSS